MKRTLRPSSAPFGCGSKNQKFSLPFFFSSAGGGGGADKKWKGNFWFCFAASKFSLSQYAKFRYCNPAYTLIVLCQTQYKQENMVILSENCGKLGLKQVYGK